MIFDRSNVIAPAAILMLLVCGAGCGTTLSNLSTEQIVVSDAVDRAVARIDFRTLAGEKVYLDTQYLQGIMPVTFFVNTQYITSSLRQQILAADCRLQDKLEDADYVIEARIGALGTNSHEVIYGMPANNLLTAASTIVPGIPSIPTIPEVSIAKKNGLHSVVKIGVFAYHRTTRVPVWQSGLIQASSTAKDTWIFGAGPFQNGSIYKRTRFAGSAIALPLADHDDQSDYPDETIIPVSFSKEHRFEAAPGKKQAEAQPSPTGETADVKQDTKEPQRVTPPSNLPAATAIDGGHSSDTKSNDQPGVSRP